MAGLVASPVPSGTGQGWWYTQNKYLGPATDGGNVQAYHDGRDHGADNKIIQWISRPKGVHQSELHGLRRVPGSINTVYNDSSDLMYPVHVASTPAASVIRPTHRIGASGIFNVGAPQTASLPPFVR